MPYKVAIIKHGFIPPYRVRFYEMLNQREGAEYVVFHGPPPSEIGTVAAQGPFSFPAKWVPTRELPLIVWRPIYQPVVREVLTGGYDAVVFGLEIKFLGNVALALLAKMLGLPVLYWDFGYHQQLGADFSRRTLTSVFATANFLKDGLTRLADGYLTYTRRGAERLKAIGFPAERTFVLNNTIDVSEQIRLHGDVAWEDPQALRSEFRLRPDSVVFLYIGRLVGAKRVDELIEAVRRLNREGRCAHPVEAVVIGAGPQLAELQALAQGLDSIRFLGDVRDQRLVARCMKVSAAVVIPGFVGLAVNHAFAQGRPIITRAHNLHSPEIEYVAHDENGLIVEGDMDCFVARLAQFAGDADEQRRLAAGALHSREELRLEKMVERFDLAVRSVIAESRARRRAQGRRTVPS